MTTHYLSNHELSDVLVPSNLGLAAGPKVAEIKFEEIRDWDGDEALDVYVILDDSTTEQEWVHQTMPISQAIWAALSSVGERRPPHIHFTTRAHYESRFNDDSSSED